MPTDSAADGAATGSDPNGTAGGEGEGDDDDAAEGDDDDDDVAEGDDDDDAAEGEEPSGSSGDPDPPVPEPFSACPQNSDAQCPPEEICIPVFSGDAILGTWCAETWCESPADCPVPSTGNAVPNCRGNNPTFCVLDCGADQGGCPEGMGCEFVGSIGFWRCMWLN